MLCFGRPGLRPILLTGGQPPCPQFSSPYNLYHAKTLGERRAARGRQPRRALLAYGVDEDDSDGHEEGDDGEGDLQDLLDDFFALDVGEATLFEQAGAVLFMMFTH